jgi:hypothetical protein
MLNCLQGKARNTLAVQSVLIFARVRSEVKQYQNEIRCPPSPWFIPQKNETTHLVFVLQENTKATKKEESKGYCVLILKSFSQIELTSCTRAPSLYECKD